MNKKHIHADVIKAWADGAEIQARSCISLAENRWGGWCTVENPEWHKHQEYRVKPQDVFFSLLAEITDSQMWSMSTEPNVKKNLKLTFDGITGKLKSAEIL
jgi:hypothetical protein